VGEIPRSGCPIRARTQRVSAILVTFRDGIQAIPSPNLIRNQRLPIDLCDCSDGDVGAGQADIDWMVYGGVTWMFNRYVGATAGYRFIGVDYSNGFFEYDMKMHGLLLGLNLAY